VPDWIAVPIGVGPLLVGIHEAYAALRSIGAIDRLPRLLAVQSTGCAPIVRAFERGDDSVIGWGKPKTVVGALADPLNGYEREARLTLRAIRESGGAAVAIDDNVTLDWVRRVAQAEGLFVEPAAAITLAGVEAARTEGRIRQEDDVTCCLTGTGLKDPSVGSSLVQPNAIQPDEHAFSDYVKQLQLRESV
jgi:threonine synthase